jgi:hypothetical protein
MTNPDGAAIVNAIGPIRQAVRGENKWASAVRDCNLATATTSVRLG